jgi:hypothetical protein
MSIMSIMSISDRLQELFERNVILLEPIIRRKIKERQRLISFLSKKCSSCLTRIDEENDEEKRKEIKKYKNES